MPGRTVRPRFCVLALVSASIAAQGPMGEARADGPRTAAALDRGAVIAAVADAPFLRVAERRSGEARATRVGAGVLAPANPELAVRAGPREASGVRSTDLSVQLTWPVDVSGARRARVDVADRRTALAVAERDELRWTLTAEALDLHARALGAVARVGLETQRVALDQALMRAATVRRDAGVTGDADVLLARVVAAEATARLRAAEAESNELAIALGGRLGLPLDRVVTVAGELPAEPPAPFEALLARVARRPDVVRAEAAIAFAGDNVRLQSRLGVPLPRVVGEVGQEESSQRFANFGVNVPLPVYQRNQTERAVAAARSETTAAERDALRVVAETELRAAWTRFEGARKAYEALAAARGDADEAERLSVRGYELGQTPLAAVLVARREAAANRLATLEARIALARARVALERASGVFE